MMEWGLRALGVFWIVGGAATLIALWRSRPFDRLLAALGGGWRWRDSIRAGLLGLGAVLTLASGVGLAALDRAAPGLMVANALVQAAWLVFAARAFPPENDDEALGRRRVVVAFVLWCLATAAVVAAALGDAVRFAALPLFEAGLAALSLALAAIVGWSATARVWDGGAADEEIRGNGPEPIVDPTVPHRWMFAPNIVTASMRDVETDQTFEPAALKLPEAVTERLEAFEIEVLEHLVESRDDPEVYVLPARIRRDLEARIVDLAEALKPHALNGEASWWLPPGEEPERT